MKAGHVYNLAPEPLVRENTNFYDVGPIQLAFEHRQITQDSIRALYSGDPAALAAFEETVAAGGNQAIDDRGLSVHVIESATGHEYLRFDCFDEDPHYHYIHKTAPGEELQNRWVRFDAAANGRMLDWVRSCLLTRLPQMLMDADATELSETVDEEAVRDLLGRIPEMGGPGETP